MDFAIYFGDFSLADLVVYIALILSYLSGYQYLVKYLISKK